MELMVTEDYFSGVFTWLIQAVSLEDFVIDRHGWQTTTLVLHQLVRGPPQRDVGQMTNRYPQVWNQKHKIRIFGI